MGFLHGFLTVFPGWLLLLAILGGSLALGYRGAKLWQWFAATEAVLFGLGAPFWLLVLTAAGFVPFMLPGLRKSLITARIMDFLEKAKLLPAISETEQTAIEAGTVWVDGELFSGDPDFDRLMQEKYDDLSAEEQAFLDGPVEELCKLVNDWDVQLDRDIGENAWQFLKDNRFFGLIIPKEYGGLGFGPSANSAIVAKLQSRSGTLCITQSVPNSLGPAELLIHYGTKEQKAHYLPRLADGREIPCFALTEPTAGSDAGSMTASGVVFKNNDGELSIRLNFNKRYITLAAVSTVLGLAFKLHDPENLLGKGEHPGITCALIPSDSEGVELGLRHDPLGTPFVNAPISGKDVVVPVDTIIGGPEQAGNGWRMLMESLAVGRGITLPSTSVGGAKTASRYIGAYAALRKQFGLPIGKFEGIEEPLARIGGLTYLMEAVRKYTCGGLDSGAKPAVVTAIAKYNITEFGRMVVNDAMDIAGGAGISRGPSNVLAGPYINAPVSITVEGANILTRTLMIFGQGAIRCHPFAYQEIQALMAKDLTSFDKAFWGHVGHVVKNKCRAIVLSFSRGYIYKPTVQGPTSNYFRKMAWASASFAFYADVAMALFGGNLKRMEKLTGRFADIFSWMYLGTAVLRRFEGEGRRREDLPFVHWSMQYTFAQIQLAFEGIFDNMKFPLAPMLAWWTRVNPIGSLPSDELGSQVAKAMQVPGEQRDRLTSGIFLPDADEPGLGRVEHAFQLIARAVEPAKKLQSALRAGQISKAAPAEMAADAVRLKLITQEEADLLLEAELARNDVIQVDAFSIDEYFKIAKSRPGKTVAPRKSAKPATKPSGRRASNGKSNGKETSEQELVS